PAAPPPPRAAFSPGLNRFIRHFVRRVDTRVHDPAPELSNRLVRGGGSVGATQWRGPADARRPAGEGRRNRSRRAARGGLSASAPRRPSAAAVPPVPAGARSEEHTSELQSRFDLVCRLLL